MPTVFTRSVLFASSYFPLAVIICLLLSVKHPIIAWSVLGIGLLSLSLLLFYMWKVAPKMSSLQVKIASRQTRGGEVMGYIASYIVPFATFSLDEWQQTASLFVFMFILWVVYINSEDMLRINPTLNLFGYRLYEITVENGEDSYALITKRRVKHRDIIQVVNVGSGIYLEKTHE